MSKLGSCSLVIEPHVFDTMLYTVKERQTNFIPPSIAQTPTPHQAPLQYLPPDMRYSSLSHVPSHHPTPYITPGAGSGTQNKREGILSQSMLPPFKEGFMQHGPEGPPPLHQNPFAAPPSTTISAQESVAMNFTNPDETQSQEEKPAQDLFIKLLAMSAASDNELKNLMKIVSTGGASQHQLDEFQVHVDSLHEQIRNGGNSAQPAKCLNGLSPSPHIQYAPFHQPVATVPTHRMVQILQLLTHFMHLQNQRLNLSSRNRIHSTSLILHSLRSPNPWQLTNQTLVQ